MKRTMTKRIFVGLIAVFILSACSIALARMQEEQVEKLKSLVPETPLRFAVITDTHVPFDDMGLFLKLPDIFEELGIQFAVHCGDMVQVGDAYHFNTYLARVKRYDVPLLPTLGNHDTSFHDYNIWTEYTKRIGDDYYYVDFGPVRLISMNDAPEAGFEPAQLDWLEAALKTDLIPMIFMHRPMPYAYPDFSGDIEASAASFKQLVEDAQVPLVFAGHTHSWINTTINGVEYVVSSGAGGVVDTSIGEHHDIVVVTVDGDKVARERVTVPLP